MLMPISVPLALLAAGSARGRTSLERCADDAEIGFRLARDNATAGVANISAVEAEANAADHLPHVVLAEIRIRAAGTGSGTVAARLDAAHEGVEIADRRSRMGLEHLSNGHLLSFVA